MNSKHARASFHGRRLLRLSPFQPAQLMHQLQLVTI